MAATLKTTYLTPVGSLRLVKTFRANGEVDAYPNSKRMTSHEREYPLTHEGMAKRLEDMRHFANIGGCLMRGNLTQQIVEESRSGKTDKAAPNQTLMLDFDKISFDCSVFLKEVKGAGKLTGKKILIEEADIIRVAELQIAALNLPNDVSYFVHASNSFGMKKDRVSVHVEFVMEKGVAPTRQKEWLEMQNFVSPSMSENIGLSRNKMALTMPLDPTVAHNTKLIYIGTPIFEHADMNPIPGHRILYVKKEKLLLQSDIVSPVNGSQLQACKEKTLDEKRRAEGLKKFVLKTRNVRVGSETVQVYSNSDRLGLDISHEQGDFVYCNVNGGDSHAYYFLKRDPTLMLNFKNEPAFRIKEAAPEFFDMVCEMYKEEIAKNAGGQFFLRRKNDDKGTIFGISLDEVTHEVNELQELPESAADDWCEHHFILRPDAIPFADIFFDPTKPTGKETFVKGNITTDAINTYQVPETVRKMEKPDFVMTYDDCLETLQEATPATTLLLLHVCGNDKDMTRHFINWLATAAQTRDKTQTTFLMQGTQGTGKGVMFEHVIKPLFGEQYTRAVTIEQLEEKYNGYLANTLMLLIDEFRHGDTQATKFLENKIKMFVTEKEMEIRVMNHNSAQTRTFFNTLFYSNNEDAIRVPEGDRRINVCPRQELKLMAIFDGETQRQKMKELSNFIATVDKENPAFIGAMMKMQYDAEAARLVIENEAKKLMQRASRTKTEDFRAAIASGDIEYFVSAAQCVTDQNMWHGIQAALAEIVKTYSYQLEHNADNVLVPLNALAPFFGLASDVKNGNPAFHMTKWVSRHQMKVVGGGLRIRWKRNDMAVAKTIQPVAERVAETTQIARPQ